MSSHEQVIPQDTEFPALPLKPSILVGPTDCKLLNITLGQLLLEKAIAVPESPCLVFPEANQRFSYGQLFQKTLAVASALIAYGVEKGDNIGIFSGNCSAYVELFFAASHVGAALVVLNTAYTGSEAKSAIIHSGCKLIFVSPKIGKNSNAALLEILKVEGSLGNMPELKDIILLKTLALASFSSYDAFIDKGSTISQAVLHKRMKSIDPASVCNLQFTSGTTGMPKAAMLTHNNIINNGHFVGERMQLTKTDILCCPPPLFHCFGLVLGLVAAITHGSCIVFPSETFNASATINAVIGERCTALHGVPAMFSAMLELLRPDMDFSSLRTGIAAGTSVPRKIMEELRGRLNMKGITNTYGMTETSPASFMTFTHDPVEKRLATVGKILPHMKAKILNAHGKVAPIGTPGELYVAGFALQKGYWRNPEKTAEVMSADEDGTIWMQTGDEATFDAEGYCRITGRIKDIIIRGKFFRQLKTAPLTLQGGENIFPLEIEERLITHPSIIQASVVGLSDVKYNEVVCAFLSHRKGQHKPSFVELQKYVRITLAWHKAPTYVFWLENDEDFPKTASGKIKKFVLRSRGEEWIKMNGKAMSKL